MKFKNAKQMYDYVCKGNDLYSKSNGIYVFVYNDVGAFCVYSLHPEEVVNLIKDSKEYGDYWGAFLGWKGSTILDDSNYDKYRYVKDEGKWSLYAKPTLAFCEETYMIDDWMNTNDVTVEYVME